MSEADVAGEAQFHKGFYLFIQIAFLILFFIKLLPSQHLALQFLHYILQFLRAVLVHFLGALLETED